jgi:DNA repair exonuclease SbcCD ATPase subunit
MIGKKCFFIIFFYPMVVFSVLEKSREIGKAEPFKPDEKIESATSHRELESQEERLKETKDVKDILEGERKSLDETIKEREKRLADIGEKPEYKEEKERLSRYQEEDSKKIPDMDKKIEAYDKKIKEAEALIETAKEKLTTIYQATRSKLEQDLRSKPENIANIASIALDRRDLPALENALRIGADIDAVKEQVGKEEDIKEKLSIIDRTRKGIQATRDAIADELEDIERAEKEGAKIDPNYKKGLENLENQINKRLKDLDKLSVDTDLGDKGFVKRAIDAATNWFNRYFRGDKSLEKKDAAEEELENINAILKELKPIASTIASIERLRSSSDELAKEIDQAMQSGNRDAKHYEELFDQANSYLKGIADLKASGLLDADQAKIDEAYNRLQEISGHLVAKMHRYKEGYNSLYEKLADYYKSLGFAGDPREVYAALGLKVDAPLKDIVEQSTKMERELQKGTEKYIRARNAGYLLRDPISKATLDTYLKDYDQIRRLGLHDPSQYTSRYKGELAALEIDKKAFDTIRTEVFDTFQDAFVQAGTYRSEASESLTNQLKTAGEVLRKKITEAQKFIATEGLPKEVPA